MPRSQQTRLQYVLQNVAERGQTVCKRSERCDNCLDTFYELNGRFMDAVDGLEREGHSRTSRLLKILRRPSRSEIWRSDNVLKTRWTLYERNCRTSDLLGTHYNVVQTSISYSTYERRPGAFLLRWSCSHTDPTRPYCDRNHFYSNQICSKQNKTFWMSWFHAPTQFIKFAVGSHEVLLVLSTSVRFSPSPYYANHVHRTMVRGGL